MNDDITEALRIGVLAGELIPTCDLCGCPTDLIDTSDQPFYKCPAHGLRTCEQAQFWDLETFKGKTVLQ